MTHKTLCQQAAMNISYEPTIIHCWWNATL